MGLFPVVQSPCPYKGPLSDIVEGDVCRLCNKQVHDLSLLTESARVALLASCEGEICVSYRAPVTSALAALALGVSAMAVPAAAQESAVPQAAVVEPNAESDEFIEIIVGGIRKPQTAQWESDAPVPKGRELPVIYETSSKGEASGRT